MSTAAELIERAFERLAQRPGFIERVDQKQLALLLSDLIAESATGAIEAPTGLGKSLAALIPAIAHALAGGKRTVIATYTNVLAEQYWRRDLQVALSLFDEEPPKTAFIIGRQRYACLTAMEETAPDLMDEFEARVELGIETEFRQTFHRPPREMTRLWQQISAPPVCPGRLCPNYQACYYYKGRREAQKALVVITNHSVVIQDALMTAASEDSEGLLGKIDFLVLDEAHDFPQAAFNGLEFELNEAKLASLAGIATRVEKALAGYAAMAGDTRPWARTCETFRQGLDHAHKALIAYGLSLERSGILTASPSDVLDHPQVIAAKTVKDVGQARAVAEAVSEQAMEFVQAVEHYLTDWRDTGEGVRVALESVRNYTTYIREAGTLADSLFSPVGVSVSHASLGFNQGPTLRRDVIGLAEPLTDLLWSRVPYACISATLAVDGSFEFFRRATGVTPDFEEILPSPFDYSVQAALYLPPADRIPDPTVARRDGNEEHYYRCVARELKEIIEACEGRTLVLFHSRKEMEGVRSFIDLSEDYPIYLQLKSGVGAVGEKFVNNIRSSMFALRSFWTGFDAPGETLSCVVLVRVPFEVPVDPPQIARLAWMQTQGLDAFQEHTLPLAKMLMRQGAGRLIRRAEDRGIICLLDPRLQTKRYGEAILENLPSEMRTFRDIGDAVGWVGLQPLLV